MVTGSCDGSRLTPAMTTRAHSGDWLVADGFVHIDAGLADQADDVIDSLLLAQLVADEQASRFTAPASWVQAFESVLSTIGWVVDHRDTGGSSAEDFVPLDTIVDDLRKVLSPEQALTLRSAVEALATAAEPVTTWWQRRTVAGTAASSTICFAALVQQAPWLVVNCNTLTAPVAVTGYPWKGAPGEGVEFTVSQASAVLNEAVFAAVRAGIRTKVAPVRANHVVAVTA
jgi:hypothetical protein